MTINLIVEIRRAPGSPAGRLVDRLVYVNGHEDGEYVLSEVEPPMQQMSKGKLHDYL